MFLPFLSAALVRWLGLTALAAVIGGLVLDSLILPADVSEPAGFRRRLRRWIMFCLLAIAGISLGELLVRVHTMAGAPLTETIRAVPTALTHTHFGTIWIARVILVALAFVVSFAGGRMPRILALLLVLAVAMTTSLIGHAADWGDLSISVAVDWVHVVAASAWTGGLIGLTLVVLDRSWPPASLGNVARRFSRVAGLCLAVVVLSGGYNAWAQLDAVSTFWTTAYGRVLAVKLLAVAALASLGAVNRYTVVPRLDPRPPSRGFGFRLCRLARCTIHRSAPSVMPARPSRFSTYVAWEVVLALAVFACTAALGESTPGRHARHLTRPPVRGPFHVTMAELHRSGGVPRDWSFTPPAGDEARGRAVFVNLECHGCHTVRGEHFPAAVKPGPDLTGVGGHHPPGYLAEAIMNPNAVIVEGPGYTGSDGLSIMPDYRDSLTLSELIDLVAYLTSLDDGDNHIGPRLVR